METAVTSNSKVAEPRSRRRRKRDSIELTLFSYVRSQCNIEQHSKSDYCTHRNCHFLNLECLERLLKSARKSIRVAMYQFSVRSLNDAILTAKENNNVDVVQVIVDNKMRLNQGATFQEMIRNDFSVKWPKTAEAMACLMHHKFILIDAEPISDGYSTSDDEDEGDDDNVPLGVPCELCSDMASDVKNSDKCVQCRPLRIRSKEDLIKFPSEVLPRLPKHGLLITGSLNWSQQAFRENFENVLITSNPRHITEYLNEFKYLWTTGLKETYTFGEPQR